MSTPQQSPAPQRGHLLDAVAVSRRQRGVRFLNDEGNPKGPVPLRDLPADARMVFSPAPALVRGSQYLRALRRRRNARRDRHGT